MNLENKTDEELRLTLAELDMLLRLEIDTDEELTEEDGERLYDLSQAYFGEIRYREMKAEHDRGEKPISAGYYAGRGYYDDKPRRKNKEFKFKVSRWEASSDEDLWTAAQTDLAKRWTTKTAPQPNVEEVWA
jgi:hypothetical protein